MMMKADASRRLGALLVFATAAFGVSCNAAIGGGVVAVLGGAGFLAGQCYDRVRVKVRDPHTGDTTCNASVWVSEKGGSERRLRPCYNAALTEGTWKLTARYEGYAPATTEITIPEHPDSCPHYTHTVELTLRREGEPSTPPVVTRSATASGNAAPPPGNPLDTAPARIVPPPIPGAAAPDPGVPTRSFEPVTPPAPGTAPAPVPAPAPAPTP
ncbi:MAG TPA: hypothetical protein VMG12_27365, partial [Polyangiaceae bacterium]|nr:hypothetical protein [Polyangiaceae bacterium]